MTNCVLLQQRIYSNVSTSQVSDQVSNHNRCIALHHTTATLTSTPLITSSRD